MSRPPSRRAVLKSAAAFGALVVAPGCHRKAPPPRGEHTVADDLGMLARVVGPWPATAGAEADALLPRYLTAERLKRFEPDRAAFAGLAARFADHPPAAESIELAELPEAERAALIALTTDLYGVMQVRFAVAGIPAAGQCQADPLWHTQVPGSSPRPER